MKKRSTEERVIGFLEQAAACTPIKALCGKHGFCDAAVYIWCKRFGGMNFHEPLFRFIAGALSGGDSAVRRCIDVAFVEGLFWQVRYAQGAPYGKRLPAALRDRYVAFHGRAP